jgi:hypothetical protein
LSASGWYVCILDQKDKTHVHKNSKTENSGGIKQKAIELNRKFRIKTGAKKRAVFDNISYFSGYPVCFHPDNQ